MKKIIALLLMCVALSTLLMAERLVIINIVERDRESRQVITRLNHQKNGDIITVFGKDDHFQLIFGREVENAMKSLGISLSQNLTHHEAGLIGESLDASIVMWGMVESLPTAGAGHFRMNGSFRSQRTGATSNYSLTIFGQQAPRQTALRNELLTRLKDFSKGEMTKLFDIALQHFHNKAFENAEQQFINITRIDPKHHEAYYYLGLINFEQNKFSEAVNFFNQSLAINPDNDDLLIFISDAYRRQGMISNAIDALERVAEKRNDAQLYYAIAMMYNQENRIDDAMENLDRALVIDPEHELSVVLYAEITYNNDMFERAIDYLEKVVDMRPDDEEASRRLALSYIRTGQLDKAITKYQSIIASDRNNIRAYQNLAAAYRTLAGENPNEANRNNRLALQAFQDALRIDPNNARIEVSIADVYNALGDLQNAERFANAAKQKQPNMHETDTILGEIAQKRGIAFFNTYVELQNLTDSGNLFGRELDDTIARRDRTKADAHREFNRADGFFREAANKTNSERVRNELNGRIQTNRQYIESTKPDFFN
jgi:tetratricopeptide (TPR) repeat protein